MSVFHHTHSPPPAPARTSAEVIPFHKTASRITCIRTLKALGRGGYLIDIGERYIVAYREPEMGDYIRVEANGQLRAVSAH